MRRPLDQFETVALAKYQKVNVKLSASPGLSREPYPFRDVAVPH
jgi:hypothetical protein